MNQRPLRPELKNPQQNPCIYLVFGASYPLYIAQITPVFSRKGYGKGYDFQVCFHDNLNSVEVMTFRDIVTQSPVATMKIRRLIMARPKFRITDDNLMYAARYLDGRLGNRSFVPLVMSTQKARMFINELLLLPKSTESAKKLQIWCDENLDSKVAKLLQTAVRKRKQRSVDKCRVVTVSTKAYLLLRKLAKRDDVTLSKALESAIEKCLRKA